MWNWLEKLGFKPKTQSDDVVVIKNTPDATGSVVSNPTPSNTFPTGPVNTTQIVTGMEDNREKIQPESILRKPLENIKRVIETSIEKGAKGPRIVNEGGVERFEPAPKPTPGPTPVVEPAPVSVPVTPVNPEPTPVVEAPVVTTPAPADPNIVPADPSPAPEAPKARKIKVKIKGKKKRTK